MNYSDLKMTYSYPKVTHSYPKVTYSDPMVTFTYPRVLDFKDKKRRVHFLSAVYTTYPRVTYSDPKVTYSDPMVTLHTSPYLHQLHLATIRPLGKCIETSEWWVVGGGNQL